MLVLVTYDVSTTTSLGRTRLRKVAKVCQNHGQRVQNSVFECIVDSTEFVQLKHQLGKIVNPEEDSLRFYQLGNNYRSKVEHVGTKKAMDVEGPLIF